MKYLQSSIFFPITKVIHHLVPQSYPIYQ